MGRRVPSVPSRTEYASSVRNHAAVSPPAPHHTCTAHLRGGASHRSSQAQGQAVPRPTRHSPPMRLQTQAQPVSTTAEVLHQQRPPADHRNADVTFRRVPAAKDKEGLDRGWVNMRRQSETSPWEDLKDFIDLNFKDRNKSQVWDWAWAPEKDKASTACTRLPGDGDGKGATGHPGPAPRTLPSPGPQPHRCSVCCGITYLAPSVVPMTPRSGDGLQRLTVTPLEQLPQKAHSVAIRRMSQS